MVPDRARRLGRDTAVAMMATQAASAEAGPRRVDIPMRPRQGPGTLPGDLAIGHAAARPNRVSGAFLIRVGILLLALLAVALYGFNRFVRPASLRGVVNAPMVTLRAPIDGTLVRGGATVGQAIRPGTDVFAVRDPRVDLHRKLELQTRLADAQKRVQALDQILGDLDRMAAELRDRTTAYAEAEGARLQATITGQETAIADARQTLDSTRKWEDRVQKLVTAGTAVEQRLEEATRARLLAQDALHRAAAARQASLTALDAARQRIFVQNGFGGAAYAQQKHDEVQVRRLELNYQRTLVLAGITSLETETNAETARVEALREIAVPSAIGGVVMAVYGAPGTEVLRGNPLADVMDCSAMYVEATISTGWFATPRAGDSVRVFLYGSGAAMTGRIRVLRDPAMALDPSRGTPLSDRENRQTLTAIIDLDPAWLAAHRTGGCPVGQPASVRFQ